MRLFPQRLQAELQNELYKHPEIPSLRSTGRPDLLDMVKKALDHRREERTEEVQEVEEGIKTKTVEDDEGPGQGENTMEARDAEGERRSKKLTLLMGLQLWIPPWLARTLVGTVEPRERKATFAPVRVAERWDNKNAQYLSFIFET